MNLFADSGRIGDALGAVGWGCTVYELAPGEASVYHWHVGEEEMLLVLAGHPTLRTPEGESRLEPWDLALLPRGEEGAHQIRNDTGEAVRAAFFSTSSDPEVVVYPDEQRIGVVAGRTRPGARTIRGWVQEPS
ncbi:MAG: cupin domain-containing protein [Acidobacteriota bacterium]|nr:cupin domain-containing protein [Acidobacteriota bacterium]